MSTQLVEPAQRQGLALSRETIVNMLIEHTLGKIEVDKKRLTEERQLYNHSSEPDRDEEFDHRLQVSASVRVYEDNIRKNKIFLEFLERSSYSPKKALMSGNIMLTEMDGEKQAWVIYDPSSPSFPTVEENNFSVDKSDLLKGWGIDEVMTVSLNCPLIKSIKDNDIRAGAYMSVGVEGNKTVQFQVSQIL